MRGQSYSNKKNNSNKEDFQGGETKVMKKSLKMLLVFALVFSMLTPALAFAEEAEMDAQAKFDAMVEAGILEGIDGEAALDKNMQRNEVAKILANIFELEVVAGAPTPFPDEPADNWGYTDGYIQAVVAAGLMQGGPKEDGTIGFRPNAQFSLQELAVVLNTVLDLPAGDEVEGKTSSWATDAVAAVVAAGLLPASADYTVEATRGDLVNSTYEVYVAYEASKVPAVLAIESAAQIGVKKVQVDFNKDAEDATFTLKRGNINVNIKEVTWNDDNTVATIETSTNLLAEDYTVSAGGSTAEFKAEVGKVTTVELTSTGAIQHKADATKADVKFKVSNQFGENVTSSTNLNWTVTGATYSANYTTGTLTITNTGNPWITGQSQVVITGVHLTTGASVSKALVIQEPAKLVSFNLGEVENIKSGATDQLLNQHDTSASNYFWVVTYEAVDQYGNTMDSLSYLSTYVNLSAGATGSSTVAWVANPASASKGVIQITPGAGSMDETVVLTAVDTTSGANSTLTFKVEKASSVKTFTMSSPSDLVVDGEAVEIPFEAVDQYGEMVTKYSDLVAVTFTSTNGSVVFVEDPITKEVTLEYTPATHGTATIISQVGIDVKQLSVSVNKLALPTVIDVLDADTITRMTKDATVSIDADSFVIKDQYDRAIDLGTYGIDTYTLSVTRSDTTTNVGISGTGTYTLTGTATAGTSGFNAEIFKNGIAVAGSALNFNAQTVAKSDISEYKVNEITQLLATGDVPVSVPSDYAVDVVVYGYTDSGAKVALAAADVQAVNTVGNMDYVTGAVYGTNLAAAGKEETATLLVAVNAANGVITLRSDITITDVAPKAESIVVKKGDAAYAVDEKFSAEVVALNTTTVNGLNGVTLLSSAGKLYFQVKDQYGVTSQLTPNFYYISEDSVNTAGTYGIGNSTGVLSVNPAYVTAGDEFTITAVTTNGLSVTVKVIVQ